MQRVSLSGLMLFALLATPAAFAGSGTFRTAGGGDKVLDFCASVRFNATPSQLQRIEDVLIGGSAVLADATDGKLRFGRVSVFNNSKAGSEAEIWINPGEGVANAESGFYGQRDGHITLYYPNNFDNAELKDPPAQPSPMERYFYTIAHEISHSLWRIFDEYSGPNPCQGDCDCEPWPGSMNASFCLMDNYYIRGGNFGSDPAGTGTYTLNEYCAAVNHDPDGDTWQETSNEQSCWETIESHWLRPIELEGALPVDTPPVAAPPVFESLDDESRYVICVDRSGSMDSEDTGDGATRLVRAVQGAHIFINCTRGGDRLGAVMYATEPQIVFPLAEVNPNDEAQTKSAAKDTLTLTTECCSTAIGLAVAASQGMLSPLPTSCNQPIILFTDGFSNAGPSKLDFIDSLIEDRIPVTTLAIGEDPKVEELIELSARTGGKHYHVVLDSDLPQTCSFMFADSDGSSVIAALRGNTTEVKPGPLPVDDVTDEVTFIFSWNNPDTVFDFNLVAPDNTVINEFTAMNDPDVDFFDGITQKVFRVRNALSGAWDFNFVILGGGHTTYDLIGISSSQEISFTAMPVQGISECGIPNAQIQVVAVPRFMGRPVTGMTVDGTVTRPDGLMETIVLLDDGGAISGDAIADDGEYSAHVASARAGPYTFALVAVNSTGVTYEGEPIFETVGDMGTILTPPPFVRSDRVTAAVVPSPNAGDIDGDGMTGILDFLDLLAHWGPCTAAVCPSDLDCDGTVGMTDFLQLLVNWG